MHATRAARAAILALLALSAAARAPAQSAFDAETAAAAGAPPRATFAFARVRSKVQPGDEVGRMHGGLFCGSDEPTRAVAQIEQFTNNNIKGIFKREAGDAGVALFEPELSPFDTAAPRSADYLLGGVLERMLYDVCIDGARRKGSLEVEVRWELYSTKLQRVVLAKTTSARFKTDDFVTGGLDTPAYRQALQALFQSPEFKALAAGTPPDGVGAPAFPPLHLRAGTTIAGDSQAHADALTRAVVTIVSDLGSGTGFYIADGYLLTDRHVVGSSKYVKVKLANGRQLVGEVIRQDASRDVALLQTESAGVPSLGVSLADPPVGSATFAIGSPLGETLAGTFTRGVLSGVRDVNGTRFFQSDVAINHGNSGGPLLDAGSHVVALAELTIAQTTGLSFFVPVKDALERLGVIIDDGAAR